MDDQLKYYLLIDTSTEVCTVALGTSDGRVISKKKNEQQNKHAEVLAPLAEELMEEIPDGHLLSGVGLTEGPGSYTGLRIGAAYAKGLCWTRHIPLVAISTPELLSRTFVLDGERMDAGTLLMPMIDARRMEVYSAIYTTEYGSVDPITALILTDNDRMQLLAQKVGDSPLVYFGSGAEKGQEIMTKNFASALYGGPITPRAGAMLPVVIDKIASGKTEDIAYWEPYYLKEYEAKKSVNKVLRDVIQK